MTYSPSGDPFSILATIIPVFFLAVVLGEGRLIPTARFGAAILSLALTVMAAGEAAAIYGLVGGGSRWMLDLAKLGALVGLGTVFAVAIVNAVPSIQQRAADNARRLMVEEQQRRDRKKEAVGNEPRPAKTNEAPAGRPEQRGEQRPPDPSMGPR